MALDLDAAVKAHTEWKVKLRVAITKREKLDAPTISRDNACPLGQWLHGEGKRDYGQLAGFGSTVAKHAAFHRCAGAVATTINSEKFTEAEAMLGTNSEFSKASMDVSVALMALRKDVNK